MNFRHKTKQMIRTLLLIFSFGFLAELALTADAQARAGGRRSFGRSQPAPSYAPQRSAPQPQQQPNYQTPPASNRGSFMRGMAGGLAGGLLGSMLFSSMGNAAGMGGAGGSGIGLIEIILVAGLAYFAFRLWKNRQQGPNYMTASAGQAPASDSFWREPSAAPIASPRGGAGYYAQAQPNLSLASARIDREAAEDIFFRIQAAWTRRDLSPVRDIMDDDVLKVMERDVSDLKDQRRINHLENISVRGVEVLDTWVEGDREFCKTRFTANLLDYTTEENSAQVLEGSNTVPVKFDECWTFVQKSGQRTWQLAGIEQV